MRTHFDRQQGPLVVVFLTLSPSPPHPPCSVLATKSPRIDGSGHRAMRYRFAIIAPTCGPSSYARTQLTLTIHVLTQPPSTPICSPHLVPTHAHTQPARVLARQSPPSQLPSPRACRHAWTYPAHMSALYSALPSSKRLPQPQARSPARTQLTLDTRPRTYTRV